MIAGEGGSDELEDLFENAPCGFLSMSPEGRIIKVNTTLCGWLDRPSSSLIGAPFTTILSAGGRIHYETHFRPVLQMSGHLDAISVDLVRADDSRLPVFVDANAKTDAAGNVVLIRVTVQDARERRSYEKELLSERRRAEHERARVGVLAATLQRAMLPPSLSPPDGLEAAAYHLPASDDDVGGDFYDLFPLSSTQWGFFLGDVSGKGAGAAAVTSLTRYTLRSAAVYDADPIAVLHNLDTVLSHEYHGDDPHFCTVIFGVLTAREGKADRSGGWDVELASGGHPPALLLRADGTARHISTAGGQFVGILSEAKFVSARVQLGAGDTLVLYTDGLTEARTGVGTQRYDDDGALLEFAKAQAPASAADIVAALQRLLAGFGSGLDDDTAILAVGVPTDL
ncbi:PP2C family protein-serine/threonine phosphatase [Williamsia soli]|uniref:PP2C family protein-serine/threonine phosphatase n=1 Tax=Williamsia soli TaxID=364929 RepID=UPI0035572FC8